MSKVCLIFPGQGSQYVQMGHDVYEHYSIAKKTIANITNYLERDISALLFNSTESELQDTKNSQIAIMANSVMLYNALFEENGLDFFTNLDLDLCCTAGHSLGEYSALHIAGVVSLEQASKLLQKRSIFMSSNVVKNAGMMAVIGCDVEVVYKIINDIKIDNKELILEVANYNSIGQVVVSGHLEAIEMFEKISKDNNIKKCIKLNVSNAFHSSLMNEAQEKMKVIIESENFLIPQIPVIQNYTAQFTSDIDQIKHNLVMQVSNQVMWVETVQNAIQHGVELFIEIGPKNVLTGLIKRIDTNIKTINIEKLQDIQNFKQNINKLFND